MGTQLSIELQLCSVWILLMELLNSKDFHSDLNPFALICGKKKKNIEKNIKMRAN
jgi:hypothetical protein